MSSWVMSRRGKQLPKYVKELEAIEGKQILCTFEHRPSIGIDKGTGRQQIGIAGNPATASVDKVWKYNKT